MPLLSTFGAASARGWIPRGNPPKQVSIYLVGGGGFGNTLTYSFYNYYGPTSVAYAQGGKAGKVTVQGGIPVTPGVAYSIAIGAAGGNSTAFGYTANGASGTNTTQGTTTSYTDGIAAGTGYAYSYFDQDGNYVTDYYGGAAYGGGGAGTFGNGGDANVGSNTPGTAGAAYNFSPIFGLGGNAAEITPSGGPGFGEQVLYGTRYTTYGSRPSDTQGTYGIGATSDRATNTNGFNTPKPGALYLVYSAAFDDPKSITGTYVKTVGNDGNKRFLISSSGSVTF